MAFDLVQILSSLQRNAIKNYIEFSLLIVLVCVFLLHQHRRAALRRSTVAEPKNSATDCRSKVSSPCSHTPNLLELQLLKPLRVSSQPAWARNPSIAGLWCCIDSQS